ncbi:hypothetical protein NDU88_005596 [Pleurodeles waltl]|uniref:Retrotransposon gag domain-containing protein n=1 Tax=Pleurodeles waltl TaxID=8319 RepID=A0AAV7UIN7_PLEWA|nr:hypothetical protein NDU88_005596 [Pleurodeles waltl]
MIHKISKLVAEEGPPCTYQSLKQALTAYFEPLANPDYMRFLLRQAWQLPEESVDTFYVRLKDLASTCTLPDVDDEVRAQFIQGCHSVKLREHILQDPGMSIADMLTIGQSKELSRVHAVHMEAALQLQVKTEPVNVVSTVPSDRRKARPKPSCTRTATSAEGPTHIWALARLKENDVPTVTSSIILQNVNLPRPHQDKLKQKQSTLHKLPSLSRKKGKWTMTTVT